jgi:hypothetical protein
LWFEHEPIGNLSNVEFVHLKCDYNLLENDDIQLTIVEVQVQQCKPHNMTSICWGFFCYQWQLACWFWQSTNVVVYHLPI